MGSKRQQPVLSSAANLQKTDEPLWSLHTSREKKERGKLKLWNSLILVIVTGSFATMRWFDLSFTSIYSVLELMGLHRTY